MRIVAAVLSLVLISTSPAVSACMVCDQIVTLNAGLAQCYLDNYAQWRSDLADGTRPFATVDLSHCANPQDLEKDFVGLPVPGQARRIKLVYILDLPGLDCIRSNLEARQEPIDPLAQIDLTNCAALPTP